MMSLLKCHILTIWMAKFFWSNVVELHSIIYLCFQSTNWGLCSKFVDRRLCGPMFISNDLNINMDNSRNDFYISLMKQMKLLNKVSLMGKIILIPSKFSTTWKEPYFPKC
jgi:hypothetical protein